MSLLFVYECMGKIIEFINNNISLSDEYKRIFGRAIPTGKFLCPNPAHRHVSNTPSCKAYGNVFKCFGQCNRVFGVYDLLKWYDPKRIDEIKSTMPILGAVEYNKQQIVKVVVDKTEPIGVILQKITGVCLHSQK